MGPLIINGGKLLEPASPTLCWESWSDLELLFPDACKGFSRLQGIRVNFPAPGLRHLKGLPESEMQTTRFSLPDFDLFW